MKSKNPLKHHKKLEKNTTAFAIWVTIAVSIGGLIELVPVFIENLNRVLPRGEFLPVPLLSCIKFGPPIWLERGEAKADFLPRTLEEALQHLKINKALRDGFGNAFIDYYCRIKEAEIARFNLDVSDWEHREYFDLF